MDDREFRKAPLEVDEQEPPAVADTIVDGPAKPLFGDAIFKCVDFEGRQGNTKIVTELSLLYHILAYCAASTSSNGELRNCILFISAFRHGLPHGFSR